jgi:hypothetical protein
MIASPAKSNDSAVSIRGLSTPDHSPMTRWR